MNSIVRRTQCLAATLLAAALTFNVAHAEKSPEVELAKKQLRAVPAAELPAKAAQLCGQAKGDAAIAAAKNIVTAAVQLRPASAVAVVGAIAKQHPELAADAAAQAVTLHTKEIAAISRAAAAAAPSQAGKIVSAICKVAPTRYNIVAAIVAQEVPTAAKEILAAVTESVPTVKDFVERASSGQRDISVANVMLQTDAMVKAVASESKITPEQVIVPPPARAFAAAPPPSLGPPFTPLLGTPDELSRTNTAEIPPGGGRNYSGP